MSSRGSLSWVEAWAAIRRRSRARTHGSAEGSPSESRLAAATVRLQLAEGVIVVEIAANVGGGALVELAFGRFDGIFEGAALGKLGGGDVACQAGMDAAIFAGGQNRSQRLIELVVRLLRGGVH